MTGLSLHIAGDPDDCRRVARRLRERASTLDRVVTRLLRPTEGLTGLAALAHTTHCRGVAGDAAALGDRCASLARGLDELADGLLDARHTMTEARHVGAGAGLVQGERLMPPPLDGITPQAGEAWVRARALVQQARRRERQARDGWRELDLAADREAQASAAARRPDWQGGPVPGPPPPDGGAGDGVVEHDLRPDSQGGPVPGPPAPPDRGGDGVVEHYLCPPDTDGGPTPGPPPPPDPPHTDGGPTPGPPPPPDPPDSDGGPTPGSPPPPDPPHTDGGPTPGPPPPENRGPAVWHELDR